MFRRMRRWVTPGMGEQPAAQNAAEEAREAGASVPGESWQDGYVDTEDGADTGDATAYEGAPRPRSTIKPEIPPMGGNISQI